MTLLKPTKQELLIAIGIILILMALTGVIFFPGCGKPTVHTVTVRDTIKLIHYDTIVSKPKVITRIKEPLPPELVPSEDCNQLKLQFQDLVVDYNTKTIYGDTITSGESFVTLVDTVKRNRIIGRKTFFKIVSEQVTESTKTTITNPPRRQLYIGGGISSNNQLDRAQANVGILYKNKRDNMLGINTGIDNKGNILYGVSYYTKISLRKR